MTLAISTNTSMDTCVYSGLKLAEQLDSREDIAPVIDTEVVDSDYSSWVHQSRERA